MNTIEKEAARDARRFAEAKMNYGKGAGTQRKLLNAELSHKMENSLYQEAFNDALAHIDEADVARRIKTRKSVEKGAKAVRNGYYTARRVGNAYNRNKTLIDQILSIIFGK